MNPQNLPSKSLRNAGLYVGSYNIGGQTNRRPGGPDGRLAALCGRLLGPFVYTLHAAAMPELYKVRWGALEMPGLRKLG